MYWTFTCRTTELSPKTLPGTLHSIADLGTTEMDVGTREADPRTRGTGNINDTIRNSTRRQWNQKLMVQTQELRGT